MNTTPHHTTPHRSHSWLAALFMMGAVLFFINADAFGQTYCQACGPNNNCNGAVAAGDCAFAAGEDTDANSNNSICIGYKSATNADNSLTFGNLLSTGSTYENNMVIGFGIVPATLLSNGMSNTIMIGANSNVSTIFIGNSGGTTGSYGNVGIGNITSPASLLHVRDQVRVGLTSGANGSLVFNNSAGNTITLNTPTSMSTQSYTLPTAVGTVNQVLALTGVSGLVGTLGWVSGGGSTTAWELTGNSNATSSSILGATVSGVPLRIYAGNAERISVASNGNVGIGETIPEGILHVKTSGNTDVVVERGTSTTQGRLVFHDEGGIEQGSVAYNTSEDIRITNLDQDEDIVLTINDGGTSRDLVLLDASEARVGINRATPGAAIDVEALADGTENMARFSVTDISNNDRIMIHNRSATDATFAGMITGFSAETGHPALTLVGNGIDSGTMPCMLFQARSTTDIGNRPLFSWRGLNNNFMQMNAAGNLGIGTPTPSGRLHVNGTVFANLSAGGTGSPMLYNSTTGEIIEDNSTMNLKEDVQDLEVVREQVLSLRPVSFKWKEACGGQSDIGLIAEEVAQIIPDLAIVGYKRTFVGTDGHLLRDSLGNAVVDSSQMEVRGVNYQKLSLYLLGVIKEQDSFLTQVSDRLENLEEQVLNCCTNNPSNRIGAPEGDPHHEYPNERVEEYVLLQNDPNPFSDYTDIKYDVESCDNCEIIIVDIQGRMVKRIRLSSIKGTVRLYSSEIGKGVFTYSIVHHGQVVKSARMISSH